MKRILVVDDEDKILFLISESFKEMQYELDTCPDAETAFERLSEKQYDLLITDLKMPGMSGIELIHEVRKKNRDILIIVMTGYATIDNAISAIREGADEYLAKPVKPFEIRRLVSRLFDERRLREENLKLKEELSAQYSFSEFITQSPAVKDIFSSLSRIIDENTSILLTGESGTGKDLLARLIHYNSSRKDKSFITFNIASRPETLVESELFGYRKGAFTGALKDSSGALEKAAGGTLFLDEIGEMKHELQVKLLQFVQYKTFLPVGGSEVSSDTRLIAATNRDLQSMVKEGGFREDLFYRLKVVHFHIPPLRERPEDIYLLSHSFLAKFNNRYCRNVHLSPQAYDQLFSWNWPGNVRELQHFLERTVLFSQDSLVEKLSFETEQKNVQTERIDSDWPKLSDLNRRYIEKVLQHCNGNRQQASVILGIDPSTIWRKLKD